MKSPRELRDVYAVLGLHNPATDETDSRALACLAEAEDTVKQERKNVATGEGRVASAKKKLEAVEKRVADSRAKQGRAKQAVEATTAAIAAATEDRVKHEARVEEAEHEVVRIEQALQRLSSGMQGTSAADDADGSNAMGALQKMQKKELDEVKALHKPPQPVRRSMELVQALLLTSTGGRPPDAVEWNDLQQMIAKSDFVARVLQLRPLPLSLRRAELDAILVRWPGLKDAASPSKDRRGGTNWKKVRRASAAIDTTAPPRLPLSKRNSSKEGSDLKPAAISKRGSFGSVAVAAMTASVEQEVLTAEAVEYASKPCGAIFRWCASVLRAASKLVAEREELESELEAQSKRLSGLRGELAAVASFQEGLSGEQLGLQQSFLKANQEAEQLDADLVDATEAEATARKELVAAQERLRAAEMRSQQEADRLARRKGQEEEMRRRKQYKDEALKHSQEVIEKDLATREPEPPQKRLAWLQTPSIDEVRPFEFGNNSCTMPADAHLVLSMVAKQLQTNPGLKLHIAGHAHGEEDPRLSSQRAQAVGAALIALGATPARLRAKGYGKTVPLSPAVRARLRLKSERRVGVHAIGEVATQYAIEFGEGATVVTEKSDKLLDDVALLLAQDHKLRLSVEGHTDEKGDPNENAKLSANRAQSVCQSLQRKGVDPTRLVAHGFGATLPVADNATAEGRTKNRRVQFLVIPDVTPQTRPPSAARRPAPLLPK